MSEKVTILIVDDVPSNIFVLRKILESDGFAVLYATNGKEGRTLTEKFLPDLILLDVLMPDESGFDVCTALKSNPKAANIPIIFISALSELDDKVKGLTLGAVDYITKPFAKKDVLARVRAHLKSTQAFRATVERKQQKLDNLHHAQLSILVKPEDCKAARFAVHYQPAEEAGGDFYDVVDLKDDAFGFLIADVSGHGTSVSFVTAALKVLFRQHAGNDPVVTMKKMNEAIKAILSEGQHITACYAYLNRRESRLALCHAGHPPSLLLNPSGVCTLIGSDGDPLGLYEQPEFSFVDCRFQAGDRLFLYTDGVIEGRAGAAGSRREEGIQRLKTVCLEVRGLPLAGAVTQMADGTMDASNMEDDCLLLGVEL